MITKYYDKLNGDSFKSLSFPEYYSPEGDVIIPEEALKKLQAVFHALEDVEVNDSEVDADHTN